MTRLSLYFCSILLATAVVSSCKKSSDNNATQGFQLTEAKVGSVALKVGQITSNVPVDSSITLVFSDKIDQTSLGSAFRLTVVAIEVPLQSFISTDQKTITLKTTDPLTYLTSYTLEIKSGLRSVTGGKFAGIQFAFTTRNGELKIEQITINGKNLNHPSVPYDIDFQHAEVNIQFSLPIDTNGYKSLFYFQSPVPVNCSLSDGNRRVTVTNFSPFTYYKKYYFHIAPQLKAENGFAFGGFVNSFITSLDSTYKFPQLSDDALLTLVQQQTFKYFYDYAHPDCGMARERYNSGDVVTTGGSGFGVMALIVGMERGFITRAQGLERLGTILGFLETCDRFHGAWPHWLNGATGRVIPFTTNDDGADLVETSYMIEGLLTMKQYLDPAVPGENALIGRITALAGGVEYDWFTRGQNVLYWHWSPGLGWIMNMPIRGYNETLITYVVAASSATHPVPAAVYHEGYAKNGAIVNGNYYYGYRLPLGEPYGGPLFFTHYSFLGMDPRNLSDTYADYWEQNVNQSLINWKYCLTNPKSFAGYSSQCWGLTASDNPWGYDAHSPANDLGVITPTAAVSALPYTPSRSMEAIRHFYYRLGDHLWGPYGFYDAFDVSEGWWADSYIAIDEGPIVCMIENYRSGLLWNLFMANPEIQQGLTKLGFTY